MFRSEIVPQLCPVGLIVARHEAKKGAHLRAFHRIGETGFEPATARPPAGYLTAGTAQARLEEASRR
jgi:hypothetical protein